MKTLPKSWKRMQQWQRAKLNRRAIEAIIAGILRGFDEEDWKEVFRRMDEQKRAKWIADRDYEESHGHDIF